MNQLRPKYGHGDLVVKPHSAEEFMASNKSPDTHNWRVMAAASSRQALWVVLAAEILVFLFVGISTDLITAIIGAAITLSVTAWGIIHASRPALRFADYSAGQLADIAVEATRDTTLFSAPAVTLDDVQRQLSVASERLRSAMVMRETELMDVNMQLRDALSESKAKSRFVANMSHELRTPLNAILGYAMLLREDAEDADNAEATADLDRILKSGRHLLTLINEILDLSKLEAGRIKVEHVLVDVQDLIHTITQDMDADERNGNVFSWHVDHDADYMIGDRDKLRRCIEALLGNAFKYTQDGRVDVAVRINKEAKKHSVEFVVEDTGIGMNEAQIKRLFKPFDQADNSETRHYSGTGVDLALIRKLVDLMGGTLSVDSSIHKGTKMTLRVPMEAPREAMQTHSKVAGFTGQKTDTRRALVIDDDDAAVDLMRRWLTRNHYDVMTAYDGDSGLEIARHEKPDLIILDILMPGRNGYDILRDIRADKDISATPVILVTVEDDRQLALKEGANELITKPVVPGRLEEVLAVYHERLDGDVLVIEDDKDAGDLVQRCAEQVGFSIRRAYDGRAGLEMVRESIPAAIILDLSMPGMDGFQVISALRADMRLRSIPVIVLSARDITIEEHGVIADAGYRFCQKGAASPREIVQNLKEVVGR